MKNRIIFLLLIAAFPTAGCVYVKDRALDFADIFVAEIHMGLGVGAEAKLTGYFGTAAGFGGGVCVPLKPREISDAESEYYFGGIGLIGGSNSDCRDESFYVGPINVLAFDYDDDISTYGELEESGLGEISLSGFVVAVGVRVGINLFAIPDFILGLFREDISGDDSKSPYGDTETIPALCEMLDPSHRHESCRLDAAKKLGRIGSTKAVPALVDSLEKDSSPDVRAAAAEALGKIGGENAIAALMWAQEYDESQTVRETAAKALVKILARQNK